MEQPARSAEKNGTLREASGQAPPGATKERSHSPKSEVGTGVSPVAGFDSSVRGSRVESTEARRAEIAARRSLAKLAITQKGGARGGT